MNFIMLNQIWFIFIWFNWLDKAFFIFHDSINVLILMASLWIDIQWLHEDYGARKFDYGDASRRTSIFRHLTTVGRKKEA